MTFTVSMVINGDARGALQALEAANRGAQGLGRGIAGMSDAQSRSRTGASSLTEATDRLGRSLRASTATAALMPPKLDAVAAAAARAAREKLRLPPAADAATAGANRFAAAMRNTATTLSQLPGPLGGLLSRFSALATGLAGMVPAGAAAAVAVTALTVASTAGIRTFADYERQLLTVEAVINATGGAAGRTTEDIDRMALSIARGTLASARDVRAAAAQVLTFRSIAGDTFDRTLELAQDLAAAGFGSIEQSAVQLAKALEDPENGLAALRRVGVSFSTSQIELIRNFNETGRAAQAQGLILDQVATQVGGTGARAGSGLAGSFDALTGATSRWFELVGGNISEVSRLGNLLNWTARGIEGLNSALSTDAVETQLEELRQRRDRLIEQATRGAAESNPLTDTPAGRQARADLWEQVVELNDRMLALQSNRALQETEIAQRSAEAQAEFARERVSAVLDAIREETEALARGALEQEIHTAARRAGVEAGQAEYDQIVQAVTGKHELAEATAAATAAAEAEQRAIENGQRSIDQLIASLTTELAVMQESDPVLRAMIGHRTALTHAVGTQAQEVERLVAALEAEQRAQAFTSEIDRLQFQTSIQGLPEVERRIAEAQRRLNVAPDSDQGRALAREIRLNVEAEEARRRREQAARSGARATDSERNSVTRLIASLQDELDILREIDPVAQEMIRHREALAHATEAERDQISALVAEIQRETVQREALQQSWDMFRDVSLRTLDDLIFSGKSFEDVMAGVARMIGRAALEAALFGTGPMAALLGGGRTGAGTGLLGALFGGLFGRADGGPIPAYAEGGNLQLGGRAAGLLDGSGGPREDNILFWGSAGEYMVNARSTAKYRDLLDAINADRLPEFAAGGPLLPAPPVARAMAAVTGAGHADPRLDETRRIELVLHLPEGVTVEQVGEIAAGMAITVQQAGARAERRGLPGVFQSTQLRRG